MDCAPRCRDRSRPAKPWSWTFAVRAPRPPGRYRIAFDFVEENRFWFAEVGRGARAEVEVLPRISERRLAVHVHGGDDAETAAALAAQEEAVVEDEPAAIAHLVAGSVPAPDWSRRLLDAHAEGWGGGRTRDRAAGHPQASVPGTLETRRRTESALRAPRSSSPRCSRASIPEYEGYPSYDGVEGALRREIVVRLRPRSGRRGA